MNDFILHILNLVLITAALLVGQQLLLFDLGVLCLGSASFFSIGAYISAILSKYGAVNPALAVFIASLASMVMAILIGYPLLKLLKRDFFAVATLGLAQATFVSLRSIAPGGDAGLAGIPQLRSPLSALMPVYLDTLIMNGLFAAFSLCFILWIRQRRIGMLITAVRLDDNALSVLGFSPVLIKVQVFALSALLAGAAGAMQAHLLGAVEPRMSSVYQTVLILCGTILSGKKSVLGTLFGALFLVALPEVLQQIFSTELGIKWWVFSFAQIMNGLFIIIAAFLLFPRLRTTLRYESEEQR